MPSMDCTSVTALLHLLSRKRCITHFKAPYNSSLLILLAMQTKAYA